MVIVLVIGGLVLAGAAAWGAARAYAVAHQRDNTGASTVREAVLRSIQRIASSKEWRKAKAAVLLSGGLDSAIVAEVGASTLSITEAITVIITDTVATDAPYAAASAAAAGLTHHVVELSLEELLSQELAHCVRVLRTFDPMALRNEVAISAGLRKAAELGCTAVATGDAADELFGGYSFTHSLPDYKWKLSQRRMADTMTFGSVPLGEALGLHVTSPFSHSRVVFCALRLSKAECIASTGGRGGAPVGKIPLRRAFPTVTSANRGKDPIEVGCGTTVLSQPGHFDARISDEEYAAEVAAALADGVTIRDKEHLFYYRVFREVFPEGKVPGKPRDGPNACPACRYPLSAPGQTFCHTCGHYDPQLPARAKRRRVT